jgi:MFS family permease
VSLVPNNARGLAHLRAAANKSAIATLILARLIYAVNWYNIGAIFSFIALDFSENVGGLGLVTGSFYLGLGLGQVPGGIVAAKIGPKKTTILGTLTASTACLLSGLVSQFYQIMPLRFLAGIGMAFVFAPGIALIARYFGHRAEGLGVGTYNAVYYLGGAVGLFGWAVFAELSGWRLSLVSSGAVGIITAVIMFIVLPMDDLKEEFTIKRSTLMDVLTNRSLILLGAKLFAITGGASLVSAIMVYYLEDTIQASPALAGLIGGLSLMFALAGSPLAGRSYDVRKNASKLLLLSGGGMGLGLALASIATISAATISTLIVGFCSGVGTTVGFSAAREVKVWDEYEALAVGWVNSLQLYSGFIWPILFALIVVHSSYMIAWLVAGSCTLILALTAFLWRFGK